MAKNTIDCSKNWNRMLILGILVGLVILGGCTSKEGPTTSTNQNRIPASQAPPAIEFSLNETVLTKNISYRVENWGYIDHWGKDYPKKGAKYIWLHFIEENVGNTPSELPLDFNVEYRGVNTTSGFGVDAFMLAQESMDTPDKTFFNGDGRDGYLYFEVSKDLGENEAAFYVRFKGEERKMELGKPAQFNGDQITISNERFVCMLPNPPIDQYQLCKIIFSLKNNWDAPILTDGIYMNLTLDGKFQNEGKVAVEQIFDDLSGYPTDLKLKPYAELTDRGSPEIGHIDRGPGVVTLFSTYTGSQDEEFNTLGKEGDTVTASITIYSGDGTVMTQKDGIIMTIPQSQ